ncbi:sterol desaturase family protein [Methylosoma difficile]
MEALIRLSAALGIFLLMVVWEQLRPRRVQQVSRLQRWRVNLGLALFNQLLMRASVGGLAYAAAASAQVAGLGLLNGWPCPSWLSMAATLLVLDFAIYGQHIAMHKLPWLWRLHQVHHSDLEFDATTALRFHPLEIILSMAYKVLCIVLLGANPLAVIAFEIILNGAATFNHSNIAIPEAWDAKLRWLLVTPDMHRIHHTPVRRQMDSNYGFSVSCWDRLCGTYTGKPEQAQTTMAIGLAAFRNAEGLGFWQLLMLPFKKA